MASRTGGGASRGGQGGSRGGQGGSRGGQGGSRGGQGGRGAKAGSHRKGAALGSGGQRKRGLSGRGATPPAELRPGHPAQRRAASAERRASGASGAAGGGSGRPGASSGRAGARGRDREAPEEFVAGRNAVVEALRARVPATVLYVAGGLDADDRVGEARKLAARLSLPVVEVTRTELDRMCGAAPHQGLAVSVPAYSYAHPDDVLARALDAPPGLVVALDGVTDPRNLGAVARSAAAFGAHGLVVPERRAAGVTASAWKASAGAVARLPVARATNLTRTLTSFAGAGLLVAGLAADGDVELADLDAATDPLVLVVGSEGRGLSRLVGERCDLTVRMSMAGPVESLNASVAAGVALYEVARRRREEKPR